MGTYVGSYWKVLERGVEDIFFVRLAWLSRQVNPGAGVFESDDAENDLLLSRHIFLLRDKVGANRKRLPIRQRAGGVFLVLDGGLCERSVHDAAENVVLAGFTRVVVTRSVVNDVGNDHALRIVVHLQNGPLAIVDELEDIELPATGRVDEDAAGTVRHDEAEAGRRMEFLCNDYGREKQQEAGKQRAWEHVGKCIASWLADDCTGWGG